MDQLEILRLKARARARMAAQQGQPAPQTEPTGILPQIGQGLVEGATGLATFPSRAGEWLGEKATGAIDKYVRGMSDEEIKTNQEANRRLRSGIDPISIADKINAMPGVGAPQTTGEKYARTISSFVPGVVMGPGSLLSKGVSALSAGTASEAAGQATEGKKLFGYDVEPYARLAAALAGGVAPAAARRVVTPNPVSPQRQRMINQLRREGVDLTAGQATGSPSLKAIESELGGARGTQIMEQQGEQFTAAALRRAGIKANRATPDVIDGAFKRIGNDFETLARRNSIPPDPQIATDVAKVVQEYAALTPAGARPPIIQSLANDALGFAQNGLAGSSYQAITSRIARMARGTNDPQVKQALLGIREALDDGMERGLTAASSPDAGAWAKARSQYRNLMVLEQAATGAGQATAEGLISPSQLRNATIQKQTRRAYARGQGDFAGLARAGEATMKPLANSGTAVRTAARNLGAGSLAIAGSLLGGGAGNMIGLPLLGQAAGAAAGLAVPRAIAAAILSKPGKTYLTNQLLPNGKAITPSQRALIAALGAGNQGNRPQH